MPAETALYAISGERPAIQIPISANDQPDPVQELAAARRRIVELERALNVLSGFTPDDNLWMQKVAALEEDALKLALAVKERDEQIDILKKATTNLQSQISDLITRNTGLVAQIQKYEPQITGAGGINKTQKSITREVYDSAFRIELKSSDRAARKAKREQEVANQRAQQLARRAREKAWHNGRR